MGLFFSPLINQLIKKLCCLPGVGPKSAQRMAFHLLERARSQGSELARLLAQAMEAIGHCRRCHNLCETDICLVCADEQRNTELLCVVEMPIDAITIEQTGSYRGYYFVLMGRLSPLDGIGPAQLGMSRFLQCVEKYHPKEVILATSTTVEGDATAYYLVELLESYPVKVSRLAHGVPLGGELEFVDSKTLSRALLGRELFRASEERVS